MVSSPPLCEKMTFVVNNTPTIEFSQADQINCVKEMITKIKENHFDVIHLIAIGGWNAPHINVKYNSQTWWNVFKEWNSEFNLFDGKF
jgi:hypothetical protein